MRTIIETVELPDECGVMILSGATLFPGSLMPLYIFEPRYRLMLTRALDADRVFAVANMEETTEAIHSVGGIGVIRACVQNEDGSSQLVLQGLERVRFARWTQIEPYRIAAIESLPSRPAQAGAAAEQMKEIRKLCRTLQARESIYFPENFEKYLDQIEDPGVFTDILSSSLLPDEDRRQTLLEELEVEERLRLVAQDLRGLLEGTA